MRVCRVIVSDPNAEKNGSQVRFPYSICLFFVFGILCGKFSSQPFGPHLLVEKGAKEGVKTLQFKKTLKVSEKMTWLVLFTSLNRSVASLIPLVDLSLYASSKSSWRKASCFDLKVARSHNWNSQTGPRIIELLTWSLMSVAPWLRLSYRQPKISFLRQNGFLSWSW